MQLSNTAPTRHSPAAVLFFFGAPFPFAFNLPEISIDLPFQPMRKYEHLDSFQSVFLRLICHFHIWVCLL